MDTGAVGDSPDRASALPAVLRIIVSINVALGTSGKSGEFPASVTEVVDCAECPVLTAPRTSRKIPEHIHSNPERDVMPKIHSDGSHDRVIEAPTFRS